MKRNYRDDPRTLITRAEDLPDFDSMTSEAYGDWWDEHDVAEGLLVTGPEVVEELREEFKKIKARKAKRLSVFK